MRRRPGRRCPFGRSGAARGPPPSAAAGGARAGGKGPAGRTPARWRAEAGW